MVEAALGVFETELALFYRVAELEDFLLDLRKDLYNRWREKGGIRYADLVNLDRILRGD